MCLSYSLNCTSPIAIARDDSISVIRKSWERWNYTGALVKHHHSIVMPNYLGIKYGQRDKAGSAATRTEPA